MKEVSHGIPVDMFDTPRTTRSHLLYVLYFI